MSEKIRAGDLIRVRSSEPDAEGLVLSSRATTFSPPDVAYFRSAVGSQFRLVPIPPGTLGVVVSAPPCSGNVCQVLFQGELVVCSLHRLERAH